MLTRFPLEARKSGLALEKIVERSFLSEVSPPESLKNITGNLVRVSGLIDEVDEENGAPLLDAGAGLMLTTNGFVLTAYHIVDQFMERLQRMAREDGLTLEDADEWLEMVGRTWQVKDQEGHTYAVDPYTFYHIKNEDLALIRCVVPSSKFHARPNRILLSESDPSWNEVIRLFALKDMTLYGQYGKVTHETILEVNPDKHGCPIYDSFVTDAYGLDGFSGGPFVNEGGEVSGLLSYIRLRRKDDTLGLAAGAKPSNIRRLLRYAADHLLGEKPE